MADIEIRIDSEGSAARDIQNIRQELALIGTELARNNRIAARADDAERDRLRTRNRELRATRQVLSATRTTQSVRLSGLRAEQRALREVEREVRRLNEARQQAFRNIAIGAGVVTVGLTALGRSFGRAAIQMEGIRDGLVALEGSAEAAESRLASLREVIRQPGVSYEAATQAAVSLRAVNLEAQLANRVIREFGNSLALVGRTDLNETLLGVRQIVSRGRVSQEELNQITERSGLVAEVLRQQFGSVLSEDIQRQIDAAGQSVIDGFLIPLVEGLEQLDRAPIDSALNSITNLQNSVFELRAGLGESLLPIVTQVSQRLTTAIDAFNQMDDSTRSTVVGIGAAVTGLAGLTTALTAAGAAFGAFNNYLTTATGARGFAGLARLIGSSGPLLPALGTIAVALTPVVGGFLEYAEAIQRAREQENLFAEALSRSAEALNTRNYEGVIRQLQNYQAELEETIRIEQRSRSARARQGRARRISGGGGFVDQGDDNFYNQALTVARSSAQSVQGLLNIFNQLNSGVELSIEQLREFDRLVARTLFAARQEGNESIVNILEGTSQQVRDLFAELEGGNRRIQREAIEPIRNFRLELIGLNAELDNAQDAFRDATTAADVDTTTQRLQEALRAVYELEQAEIQAELNRLGLAISRLPAEDRINSELVTQYQNTLAEKLQLDVEYERDADQIRRDGTDAQQQILDAEARATEAAYNRRLAYGRRYNAQIRRQQQERANEFARTGERLQAIEDEELRARLGSLTGQFINQGLAPQEALDRALNFRNTLEGLPDILERAEAGTRALSFVVGNQLRNAYQDATRTLERYALRTGASGNLTRLPDALQQAELSARERTPNILQGFFTSLDALSERTETRRRIREGAPQLAQAELLAIEGQRLSLPGSGGGGLSVFENQLLREREELDARQRSSAAVAQFGADTGLAGIDAVVNSLITIPSQLNREIENIEADLQNRLNRLQEDTQLRIEDINEDEVLSASLKAQRIEDIEQESADRRVQIQQAAAQQIEQAQRLSDQARIDSFRGVVSSSLLGIAQIVRAEAQAAIAKHIFDTVRAGTYNPLAILRGTGGLAAIYAASTAAQAGIAAILPESTPATQVFAAQTSQTATARPLTRAAAESGGTTVADITVNVEASGTRLGQANSRQEIKNREWGG